MLSLLLNKPASTPLKLLCLGAHSDDIEIGCGGTILSLLEHYPQTSVRWVVFSGNEQRQAEAKASASAFLAGAGQQELTLLAHRDGFFPYIGAEIKSEFEVLKQEFQPDVIFTHFRDDRHQDHRVISDLTWNTFRNHLVLEYEIPKYDGDLGHPNLFVPLSEPAVQLKIQHLLDYFGSQRSKQWFDRQTFLGMLRLRGMEANSATTFAEAFYGRKVTIG